MRSQATDGGKPVENKTVDNSVKAVDPLDRDKEEKGVTASAPNIKNKSASRGIAVVAIILISGAMVFKVLQTNPNTSSLVQKEEAKVPLAKRELPLNNSGEIAKSEAKDKYKRRRFAKQSNSDEDFIDPDLPPLEWDNKGRPIKTSLDQPVLLGVKEGLMFDTKGKVVPPGSYLINYSTGKRITKDGERGYFVDKRGVVLVDENGNPREGIFAKPKVDLTNESSIPDPLLSPNLSIPVIEVTDSTVNVVGQSVVPPPQAKGAPPPLVQAGSAPMATPGTTQPMYGPGGQTIGSNKQPYIGSANGSPSGQQQARNSSASVPPYPVNGATMIDANHLGVEERRSIPMFVMLGEGMSKNNEKPRPKKKDIVILDPTAILETKTANRDPGLTSRAGILNLNSTLLIGTVFECVLITAINTQFPGSVRAVVVKDVRSATGVNIIVPKGSILTGSYSSTVNAGQSRLEINFNTVMRPQGDQYTINARATDQYGRFGIQGDIDNRFGENAANAAFQSISKVAVALLGQWLQTAFGGGSNASAPSQTVNNNGTFTTTGVYPIYYATQSAIQSLSAQTDALTQSLVNLPPIIQAPHGLKFLISISTNFTATPAKTIKLSTD